MIFCPTYFNWDAIQTIDDSAKVLEYSWKVIFMHITPRSFHVEDEVNINLDQ